MHPMPQIVAPIVTRIAPLAGLVMLLFLAVALASFIADTGPSVFTQAPADPLLGPFRWHPLAPGLA